jgi:HSP20 family molecular chaperone IbpA
MPVDWKICGKRAGQRAGRQIQRIYEFVMLAIDMKEGGDDLVVTIDLPGFAKKDITISGLSAMSCP